MRLDGVLVGCELVFVYSSLVPLQEGVDDGVVLFLFVWGGCSCQFLEVESQVLSTLESVSLQGGFGLSSLRHVISACILVGDHIYALLSSVIHQGPLVMVKVVRHDKTIVIGAIKVLHKSLGINWKLLSLVRHTLFLKRSMTINGVQKWV